MNMTLGARSAVWDLHRSCGTRGESYMIVWWLYKNYDTMGVRATLSLFQKSSGLYLLWSWLQTTLAIYRIVCVKYSNWSSDSILLLQTALHWGAKHGNMDIVKLIAGSCKLDANVRSVRYRYNWLDLYFQLLYFFIYFLFTYLWF